MRCPPALRRIPERNYKKELQIMTVKRDFWKVLTLTLFTTNILYCLLKALF